MLDAHQIAQGIASGGFSAREVVAACIRRIEASHAAINAVVVPRFEQALREARRSPRPGRFSRTASRCSDHNQGVV